MPAASVALFGIGWLIMAVAGIVILIKAFQTSLLWGLGYLFVPFVGLIFIALYWHDTKKPFLYLLGGGALVVLGAVFSVPANELAAN